MCCGVMCAAAGILPWCPSSAQNHETLLQVCLLFPASVISCHQSSAVITHYLPSLISWHQLLAAFMHQLPSHTTCHQSSAASTHYLPSVISCHQLSTPISHQLPSVTGLVHAGVRICCADIVQWLHPKPCCIVEAVLSCMAPNPVVSVGASSLQQSLW